MKNINPWPLGLTFFILFFVAAVIGGSLYLGGEKVDIVAADYYEQGQKYQSDIDARKRTAALSWKPRIAYDRSSRSCAIQFPNSVRQPEEGKALFFCVAARHGSTALVSG